MFLRYNYRLYPNKGQQAKLNSWLGQARFVWNYMLKCNIDSYNRDQKFIFEFDMNNKLPELKKNEETLWLKEIPSQCLQQKCQDLSTALKSCGKSKSSRKGFPNFKSRRTDTSGIRFPKVKVEGDRLVLPKLKEGIRIKLHRPIIGSIGATTIYRDVVGHYYASILCKVEDSYIPTPIEVNSVVGIDLGLKEFLISSDGELIENPKYFRKSEVKLKRAQRKHSRKKKASKNRNKARIRVAKVHRKIKNQRKNFVGQLSSSIAKDYDLIALESLNIKGMIKNRCLSKSISDASWSMFVSSLKWQCLKRGKTIVHVGTFFPSSKTCSCCGEIKTDLKLSDRTYECSSCGFEIDRDLNAAINIRKEGLRLFQNTAGTAEINACRDMLDGSSSA